MKRIATLLLALAMLLPTVIGIIPPASASTQEKPFYGLGWSAIAESLTPNCDDVVTIGVRGTADLQVEFYKDDKSLGNDAEKLLNWVKAEMDKRPAGNRYLHVYGTLAIAKLNPQNVIDLSDAFNKLKVKFTDFLQRYKNMGGQLDGLVLDCEYLDMYAWYIYTREYTKDNKQAYNQIVSSDVYKNVIRPQLVERGFKFWPEPSGEKSEIWGVYPYSPDEYTESRRIWDKIMRNHLNNYLTDALYTPFIALYPNGWVSDYQSADSLSWDKGISSSGTNYAGGNGVKVGNTSNINAYNVAPGEEFYYNQSAKQYVYYYPASYNGVYYERTPFNSFMWSVNSFRILHNATDTKKISAWIAGYDYRADRQGSYANTPYYSEMILHTGLLDPEPFLLYIFSGDYKSAGRYNIAIKVVSQLLYELTRLVGTADREPIAVQPTWNYGFMLSGMYAGGRNVWRITPDTTRVGLNDFKQEGRYPTFSVDGVTVIFPQGKIVETAAVDKVGTCGYWVETPKNVQPIYLYDTDRYSKDPSFVDGFESYPAGTALTNDIIQPKSVWEISGTSPVVQEVNRNKQLALTGNTVMYNVKLPKNVTAGDFYADQQAWEVTVTLPSAGQLILLTAGKEEGGIKIEDGKVYYTNIDMYKELSGVSLAAGSTYKVKRELDLRNNGAHTSSYYIYDANGKELGSAKNVAITNIATPVEAIGIFCTKVQGTAYVDNYTLYPKGVTKTLEVYDAASGMLVADGNQARAKSSAYRLAWMNAEDKAKAATVVATYYDASGRQLSRKNVEEVLMMPGADGVATGVVDVPQGQKVLLTMEFNENPVVNLPEIDNTPLPDDGNNGGTTDGNNSGVTDGNNGGITDGNNGDVTDGDPDGTPEDTSNDTTDDTTGDTTQDTTGDTTGDTTDDTTGDTTDSTEQPAKPAKKKNTGLILFIVADVLVLGLVGFLAYMLIVKKKQAAAAEGTLEDGEIPAEVTAAGEEAITEESTEEIAKEETPETDTETE